MSVNFSLGSREEVPKTIMFLKKHTQSSDPKGTLSYVGEYEGTPMISSCSDSVELLIYMIGHNDVQRIVVNL